MSSVQCYSCDVSREDWLEPCPACGSRASYSGRPLRGRYPDFGEDMPAPAFLFGEMPCSEKPVLDGAVGIERRNPRGYFGNSPEGRRVAPGSKRPCGRTP